MKKFFSAFLLMTVMVFSVGTFVSCNDLKTEIEGVKTETTQNEADIKALTDRLAALQTALDAAEAKGDANAAEIASLKAQVKAVEEALATIEALGDDVDAVKAEIKKINDALAGCATQEAVDLLNDILDEYTALTDENAEAIAEIKEAIAALQDAEIDADKFAEIVEKMASIDGALVAFESRIQSVAYVPQTLAPAQAVQYVVGNKETDYLVRAAYQVSPVSAVADLEDGDVYFKGLAVKAEAPAKFNAKVLSVDEENGMVELLCYIPEEAVKAVTKSTSQQPSVGVAVALVIENEAGVEITSTYETFPCATTDITTAISIENNTHEIPYDTAIADSKVDLINSLEFVVTGGIFVEETPLAEALELLGMDYEVVRNPENRFGVEYIEVKNNSEYDPDDEVEDDEFDVLKATVSEDKKNVTAEFAAEYADVEDATELIGANVVVTLDKGYFTVAEGKLDGVTVTYKVVGKENKVNIEIEDIESAWLPVAKFIDVPYSGISQTDFNKYHPATVKVDLVDADENKNGKAVIVATSHDDMTVTLEDFAWPEETTTYTVKYEFDGATDNETKTKTVYSYEFTITVEGRPEDVVVDTTPETLPTLDLTDAPNVNDPEDLYPYEKDDLESKVVVGAIATELSKDYAAYYDKDQLVAEIGAELQNATWEVYKLDKDTDEVASTALALSENAVSFKYVPAAGTTPEKSEFVFPYDIDNYEKLAAAKAIQIKTVVTLSGVKYEIRANMNVAAWTKPALPGVGLAVGKYDSKTLKGVNPIKWKTEYFDWSESVFNTTTNVYNYVERQYTKNLPESSTAYTFLPTGGKLKLADYMKVVNVPAADLDKYYIRVKMTEAPTFDGKVDGEDSTMFHYYANPDATGSIPTIYANYYSGTPYKLFNGAATAKVDTVTVNHNGQKVTLSAIAATKAGEANNANRFFFPASQLEGVTVDWNGSHVNKITLKADLIKIESLKLQKDGTTISTSAYNDYMYRLPAVATHNVVFETPKAIATFEAVQGDAYEYKHGEDLNIQIAKHINVVDLFGQQISNPYGQWKQVWSQYEWSQAVDGNDKIDTDGDTTPDAYPSAAGEYVAKSGTPDFFKVYGQVIELVDVKDERGNVIAAGQKIKNNLGLKEGTDFNFDDQYGIITIPKGLANFSGELTFTVRVKLSHMLDAYVPFEQDVTVKVVNAQ